MVRIVDFKTYKREEGTEFCVLIVQGGVEAVKSKETGKLYLTARKARVPSTFDVDTCKALLGTELEGSVKKVEVEPYEYTDEKTGDILSLTHRYEYLTKDQELLKKNVVLEEVL
ncbi:hypothetical protein [Tenacibaculum sp. L6]|uniref:hypothetical protein n=1 Tax=Tenacibaculum sp. L6 TaxID=2992764 RepID=UPI00237B46A2|nr:hypothetical protein [Tenacibaculum sp. L6]MDE0536942.1 hypothetical protein [Tenacibaculum sp. L6]